MTFYEVVNFPLFVWGKKYQTKFYINRENNLQECNIFSLKIVQYIHFFFHKVLCTPRHLIFGDWAIFQSVTAQELHAEVVYGVFLWPIVKYFIFNLKQRYQCGCILSREFGVGSFPLCHTMGSKLKHRYFRIKTDLKDRAREREPGQKLKKIPVYIVLYLRAF